VIDVTEMVRHGRRSTDFLLADVDGEAYRSAVGYLRGEKARGDSVERRFLVLTALASAYILMIPARSALDTPDGTGNDRLVDRFDIIVGVILALSKRMRETGGDGRAAVSEPVTEDDSREALRGGIDCKQPVQVLFAQADTFSDIAACESDPYVYAVRNAISLYRTINKHFTTHRFDFVSAFAGYQENDDFLVDYKCPTYGAAAAFDWITRMSAGGWLSTGSTAAAKITRSLLDATFRKTMARMSGR
jgi:hypothetical protein